MESCVTCVQAVIVKLCFGQLEDLAKYMFKHISINVYVGSLRDLSLPGGEVGPKFRMCWRHSPASAFSVDVGGFALLGPEALSGICVKGRGVARETMGKLQQKLLKAREDKSAKRCHSHF